MVAAAEFAKHIKSPINCEQHKEMGFIMEFAENLILRMMEDPKERDMKFREHLYDLKDRCQKTKEMWSLPLRPYGFWNFDRHNAQIFSLRILAQPLPPLSNWKGRSSS
ncbi:unnamed protein product [Fraxinus pennsylvanica]|uniref:Uncharacterized protein n=1 Tax=Fraxinus pennsylvanica TaxID=56036 RepID=A0AAD2ACI7_9LAMI|nr:unnamed protein product [Fraxinus pennsylvanica]